MSSGNERERCLKCGRRRSGSGALPLRRWLKPIECKHKRDCDSSSQSDCSSIPFWKIWKTKVLFASVRSLQHFFSSKVNRETFMTNLDGARKDNVVSDSSAAESFDLSACRRGSGRCQHAGGYSVVVLRGHHFHATPESCALYCQLSKHGWYWGGITSKEAEELLAGQHDNVFLVRDSYNSRHLLCVSFRCAGRTLHTRLRHANGLFSLNDETFVPVNNIPEHCSAVDVATALFDIPVRLARPLNRFAKLSDSLQMLCRFVIRQKVSSDRISQLPLPPNLVKYVTLGTDYIVDISAD